MHCAIPASTHRCLATAPLTSLRPLLQAMMTLSIVKFLITLCLAEGPVNSKPSATFWYLVLYLPYTGFLNFLHVSSPPLQPGRPRRPRFTCCPCSAPVAKTS